MWPASEASTAAATIRNLKLLTAECPPNASTTTSDSTRCMANSDAEVLFLALVRHISSGNYMVNAKSIRESRQK